MVATPIGHAGDITLHALEILKAVRVIACEDTRVSAKLMQIHGVRTPLIAYHDHNADQMRPRLLADLHGGAAIALISDAGTPLVSDPGYKLVRDAIAAGIRVHVAPGPSAPIAALILSGLPSDRFFFAGFLDAKQGGRRRDLALLAAIPASLIFFEAAPRLARSLGDMADLLGDRPAAVAREITKFYEEVRRGTLGELARHYAAAGPPKGEIVVVVAPPSEDQPAASQDIDQMLRAALAHGSVRDAADQVAASLRQPRRAIYARALALAQAIGADAGNAGSHDSPDA